MKVAIIPARGTSKRVPRKNIRPFCGKPMIEWSIHAARASGLFNRILVSTDDREIATVAINAGAEAPFVRPASLSDDYTPTIPVIRHAIDWLEAAGTAPDAVCCLYATAPFVSAEALRCAYDKLSSNNEIDFIISATEFRSPIFRALRIDRNGRASMFWPEYELTRSQDLERAYHDAGQFYWGRPDAFRTHDGFFSAQSRLFPLPQYLVHDIDTIEDWTRAELIFNALKSDLHHD